MFNKLTNKIIFKKYKILKIIGRGSFGSVYKGKNIITNEPVAIKVEEVSPSSNVLENEAYILFYLKNYGIPELKSFGIYKRYKMLVQTLLGDNMENIFSNDIKHKTIKDICMIAIQLIDRLEFIHSKYIIHRDLKPENIMIDLKTKSIVYLIDFGMAKKYRSGKTKKHIKFSIPYRLTGTARYCSVNALRGTEQSRRDDLESAGYVLIYLAQSKFLPWMGLNIIDKLERYRAIYQIKKRIKPEELCKALPSEFCDYITYVKKLNFEQDPDYNYLRGLFINILKTNHCQNDLKFSWSFNNKSQKKDEEQSPTYKRINSFKRRVSPQQRILQNIQTSLEKEKKINNLNQEKLINIIEENQEKRDKQLTSKNNIKKIIIESPTKKNNDFDPKEDTPSFTKIGKKDNCSESGSKIAHINLEIILDESDLNNNKDETQENENDMIINNIKKENEIVDKVCNNISTDFGNNKKNMFLFENESFKGEDRFKIFKKNDNNNIIINNSKEKKILELNQNNLSIKNNKNIGKENFKENVINPINKTKTKKNQNNIKIIKLEKNNSPNENQIQRNKINNILERKKPDIKKFKINIDPNNIINNLYFNNNPPTRYSSGEKNNYSIYRNISRRNINNYNTMNKSKSNRNVISFNKINIPVYNHFTEKINKNKKINFMKSDERTKMIINNSAKQINNILRRTNYIKMFYQDINNPNKYSKNLNPNKKIYLSNKANKIIRIGKKSDNNIIISKSQSPKDRILNLNLFRINPGQINPKFNNNIINNINYSFNLKPESSGSQINTLENHKSKTVYSPQYSLSRGKKIENQKLKRINIDKNFLNNYSNLNQIKKNNSSYKNKKKLKIPILDSHNFLEYNSIINNNSNNTFGNI